MPNDIVTFIQALPARLRALVRSLQDFGYRFERPDEVLPGPAADVDRQIQRLEGLVGQIPLALAQFYRTVGSIDLAGFHPRWGGCDYPDPLIVYPIDAALEEAVQYAELQDPRTEYWASESGVFRVPIAPDALHKANVSGGMWYGVEIPNGSEDPLVLEDSHGLPFSAYLDFALSWGGFPGLATAAAHTWPLSELRRAAGAA